MRWWPLWLGLFIGPVLMALLVAIWREWMREVTAPTETSVNHIIKG